MAVNSSSSSNDSLLHASLPLHMHCLFERPSSFIFTAFSITSILLFLPLFVLVLYLGQRRQRRSASSAAAASHSDTFTYHMTSMELIGVLGCIICCCGIYVGQVFLLYVGFFLRILTWYGETFFHMLTCVERYLAVVHPVTYLSLRRERGVRIRNISIGCVWLLCFGASTLQYLVDFTVVGFSFLVFSLVVISFCSLSVLRVLIRPGPGEQGGDRNRVDQSKRRAFYTIMAILGVLLVRFAAGVAWSVLYDLKKSGQCWFVTAEEWFNVPSSLVIPLLFVHRAGTLACRKNNT